MDARTDPFHAHSCTALARRHSRHVVVVVDRRSRDHRGSVRVGVGSLPSVGRDVVVDHHSVDHENNHRTRVVVAYGGGSHRDVGYTREEDRDDRSNHLREVARGRDHDSLASESESAHAGVARQFEAS